MAENVESHKGSDGIIDRDQSKKERVKWDDSTLRRRLSTLSIASATNETDRDLPVPKKEGIKRDTLGRILKYAARTQKVVKEMYAGKKTISNAKVNRVIRCINRQTNHKSDMENAVIAICEAYASGTVMSKDWIDTKADEAGLNDFNCSYFTGEEPIKQLKSLAKINVGAEAACKDAIEAILTYQKTAEKIQDLCYLDRLCTALDGLMKRLEIISAETEHISNLKQILSHMILIYGGICQTIEEISCSANNDLVAKWLRGETTAKERVAMMEEELIYNKGKFAAATDGVMTRRKHKIPSLFRFWSSDARTIRNDKTPLMKDLKCIMRLMALGARNCGENENNKAVRMKIKEAMNYLIVPGGLQGECAAKEVLKRLKVEPNGDHYCLASRLVSHYT